RPLAEQMVKEAERLAHIVDDLLDLSIIESQGSPNRAPVPASTLLDEAIHRTRPAAAANSIELRVQNDAGDQMIECYRRQAVSAIANLLDNAVKYSDPGGIVELRTHVDGG